MERRTPWWREPTLHFVALGAALFLVHRILVGEEEARGDRRIVVARSFVDGLARAHAESNGRPADAATLGRLVEGFVDEEVLYRQALALGLDSGDTIIRRRLAQKMEFLLRDQAPLPEPTRADLERHLSAHEARFGRPERVRLTHRFFARDRRGRRAHDDAVRAVQRLRDGGALDGGGDPFLTGLTVGPAGERDLIAQFGPGFAAAVRALPVGPWSGPIESPYGHHVVRIVERLPAYTPSLDEAMHEVRASWESEQRARADRQAMQALRAEYVIDIEQPAAALAIHAAGEGDR